MKKYLFLVTVLFFGVTLEAAKVAKITVSSPSGYEVSVDWPGTKTSTSGSFTWTFICDDDYKNCQWGLNSGDTFNLSALYDVGSGDKTATCSFVFDGSDRNIVYRGGSFFEGC